MKKYKNVNRLIVSAGIVIISICLLSISFFYRQKMTDNNILRQYIADDNFDVFTHKKILERISFVLSKKKHLSENEQLFLDKRHTSSLYWEALLFTGKLDKLIELYSQCIEINNRHKQLSPQNYQIYINIAEVYSGEGAHEEALEYFNRAIIMNPMRLGAYLSKAYHLYRNKIYQDARGLYKKVLSIDENNYEAHFGLGQLCYLEREYEQALFHGNKAILINPKYTDAYVLIGKVYLLGNKDFEQAEIFFNKALKLNNDHKEARNFLNMCETGTPSSL